jgi:metallo-beta-lactamase family protein
MQMKLRFLGAARNVTGSRTLLEADGSKLLVDCGLYQERELQVRNWDPFPVPPKSIDAVFLTHAHLDHCGLLPKLAKDGFSGKIYCTQATAEIAKIILLDCAQLLEEDAEHKLKRHKKEGREGPRPVLPLYTTADAEACFPLFAPVEYKQPVKIDDGIEVSFYDAGHVLGSSIIKVKVNHNGDERIVLFSGDVGRSDRPFVGDPTAFDKADYVLVESTYGDRLHQNNGDIEQSIADVINSTKKAGGNIIVPSFALERSQELLYYINDLLIKDAIPHLMVFLDSPMASKITEVFKKHPELFSKKTADFINNHNSPFNLPGLKMVETTEESKAINHIKGTIVVIAGSGMCTGGRIKHHLINNISRPECTIMFVGYQAIGTLGRQIVDGNNPVRILGQEYPVRAKIAQIKNFSAHADRDELLNWLTQLKTPPRGVFVVHGEPESASHFSDYIREKTGWNASAPNYLDEIVLN